MKNLILISIILILFASCSSKRKVVRNYERTQVETSVTTFDSISQIESLNVSLIDTTKIKETINRVIDTEFSIITDSVSGTIVSVPIRTITTETITRETNRGVSDTTSKKTEIIDIKIDNKEEIISDEILSEDIEYQPRRTLKEIIYSFLLTVVITLIGGYIVLKKYFPSIFVKIIKRLKL